ncbi:hypothetical protein ABB37_09979 [Leptomonas pyrrhocoris]|uniref:Uncharacterized protein n=1 Tax=Leptomonas pyrrhocoris TaxID=157538 RepID=A0A0M9FPC1_LEPPY|nr:hypothetical protein ABB37_09979 [Leptomonas pyrrhocoris]KPA73267.1 hypothetical protein ABB37_09979 [Leptomonas pyrrhocoris]|eukprot:XP_015651706.1 hypothetical protein ABB37_09979 [Leptomonas pyrrhocoris]
MKQHDDANEAAEGAAAAAPAGGVDRVPKVRLDVLTSRLLHEQDYGELSSSSSLSSNISNAFDAAAATTTTFNTVPRMPLSALAKAEAQLKKPVALSHGGLTTNFSREDIQHITDPDVLRYLAGDASPNAPVRSSPPPPPPPSAPKSEMEAHMEALQREIDTFITAVDNEGRSYEIRIGASGGREVLIADEEPDAASEENEEEDETEAAGPEQPAPPSSPEAATVGRSPPPQEKPRSATTSAPPPLPRKSPFTAAPSQQRRPATEKSARVRTRPQHKPSPPAPAASSSSRATAAAQPPTIPVRPRAGLTEAEEGRVAQLLDGDVFAALTASNPFACRHELVEKLGELDEKARRYAAIRDGQQVFSALGRTPSASHDGDVAPRDGAAAGDSTSAPTATELGNAYMRDTHQAEQTTQQLRSVNERLRALQRLNEALALAPADDTPADVLALRPAWARSPPLSVDEAEVQRLLAAARAEEVKAREVGLAETTLPPVADPYARLRGQLQEASGRAMELLKMYDATPPALRRAPSPLRDGTEESPNDE